MKIQLVNFTYTPQGEREQKTFWTVVVPENHSDCLYNVLFDGSSYGFPRLGRIFRLVEPNESKLSYPLLMGFVFSDVKLSEMRKHFDTFADYSLFQQWCSKAQNKYDLDRLIHERREARDDELVTIFLRENMVARLNTILQDYGKYPVIE